MGLLKRLWRRGTRQRGAKPSRPRVNDYTLSTLGMAYLATVAADCGFNVAVLDARAHGLPIGDVVTMLNDAGPRWAGVNLLAPT
ncbi:hypothetical protein E1264_23575 [Actinomadura sp. KC216]|uniref:hypothetical protein n=1 Tax=Actinomadura sp. KC216 TaxID=2530370 RepID=UPI001044C8AA|nr:hypothetical protein [Actinomadura sp. KC216]TDB84739.1 hypothetical protein E1264_23575 [Actinomadura sp. KC216]